MGALLDLIFTDISNALTYIGLPSLTNILWAIIIFFIGRWLAKRARNWLGRAFAHMDINQKLIHIVESVTYYAILTLAILFSMTALGIPVEALISIFVVMIILLAIALQSSLSNFAATIIFMVFQTFKVGDWIEVTEGIFGQVKELQMFSSVLITQDKKTVTIPNGRILLGDIINYSVLGWRRVDMQFTITYQDDLLTAKRILEEVLAENEHILSEPAPVVGVLGLGDKGVDFSVWPFVKVEDFWDVKFEVTEAVKLRFDEAGITLPVTRQDIHLLPESPNGTQ